MTRTLQKSFSIAPPKSELLIPLHQAIRASGERFEIPPHPATLVRWVTRGVFFHGKLTRLEAIRVGGRWHTTREAVKRFFSGSTIVEQPEIRSPSQRERAADKAEREAILRGA